MLYIKTIKVIDSYTYTTNCTCDKNPITSTKPIKYIMQQKQAQ